MGPKNTWAKIIAILIVGIAGSFRVICPWHVPGWNHPLCWRLGKKCGLRMPYDGYLKTVATNPKTQLPLGARR